MQFYTTNTTQTLLFHRNASLHLKFFLSELSDTAGQPDKCVFGSLLLGVRSCEKHYANQIMSLRGLNLKSELRRKWGKTQQFVFCLRDIAEHEK